VPLDESRDRCRRAGISSRSRRTARENSDERNSAVNFAGNCDDRMTISAALLAGGKSVRMGHDKATLLFHGQPLWKRQLEILYRLEPKRIFVSGRTDPPWRPADVEFVADQQPSRGPLSGIAAALSRITTDYVLVLAVDVPFVTVEYLKDLCAGVEVGRGVIPIIGTRAEPLVAIYPREAGVDFQNALVGNDFALQPVVRELLACGKLLPLGVRPDKTNLFRNLNEPHELERS
jgi:molybdenum cofactor guanylyltransferase